MRFWDAINAERHWRSTSSLEIDYRGIAPGVRKLIRRENPARPDSAGRLPLSMSVVVPVYNAMPYLRELLDSLVTQDLDATCFNVIAVDDGSTDGSSDLLEEYGGRHGNVDVLHCENSGWPGRPRNLGLRSSTASHVFFADADDVVGPESLRRLLSFAEAHDSDIVIPKMVGFDGRSVSDTAYKKTRVDAALLTAFNTLSPVKLYRRSLLSDNDIWFPEGRVRLEDGIFNARAYVCARRISIVCDYDYYFARTRTDGRNISMQGSRPSDAQSVAEICRIVRASVNDSAQADRIVLDLYRRKCLNVYRRRFARCSETTRDEWLAEHQAFIERFVSEAMEQRLQSPFRERSYLVRRGDKAGLLALSGLEASRQ